MKLNACINSVNSQSSGTSIVVADAGHNLGPGLAVVAGPVNVRAAIVELIALGCEECGGGVVRRRINETDAAELGQAGRRDLGPPCAAVARDPHPAVIGAGPDGVHVVP